MEKNVVIMLDGEKEFSGIFLDKSFFGDVQKYLDQKKFNRSNKYDNFTLFKKKDVNMSEFLNDFQRNTFIDMSHMQIFQGFKETQNEMLKDIDSKLDETVQKKINKKTTNI